MRFLQVDGEFVKVALNIRVRQRGSGGNLVDIPVGQGEFGCPPDHMLLVPVVGEEGAVDSGGNVGKSANRSPGGGAEVNFSLFIAVPSPLNLIQAQYILAGNGVDRPPDFGKGVVTHLNITLC